MTPLGSPHPSPAPRAPLHQMVASDLRALAALAAAHPDLAVHLADTVSLLCVVVPYSHTVGPDQHLDAALAAGATEVPPAMFETAWETRDYRLPAGAVRVSVTRLRTQWEPADVEPVTCAIPVVSGTG